MKNKHWIIGFIVCLVLSACASKAGFETSDMTADFNGKTLELDADVSQVFAVLGEEYAYSEQDSCYYPGKDKSYTYPGVTVVTYPTLDGAEKVVEIRLTDDTYATAKGAKIGMSKAQIEETYGIDHEDAGILMNYYASDAQYLSIAVLNDAVDQIRYILIP